MGEPHKLPPPSGEGRYDWAGHHVGAVDLRGWHFAGAQLQQANFRGADLRGVGFRDADVRGAIFDEADLRGADFTGAFAQNARFRRSRLDGTSFRQALLLSAHMEHARVPRATFAAANLEWAWVEGVDFRQAVVACAVFLNVRGLSEEARNTIEQGGGFTGARLMILGRELYEQPAADDAPESGAGGGG